MFFLESKTIPGCFSFYCVIALEYSLPFSNLSGEPSLHPVSIQRKEMKFGQSCHMPAWKKWYDGINEEVSVEENNVLLKFLHPIDPSVYLHWPSIDAKCWVPVNHVLQLLFVLTVNTLGHPYTFLKSEFKDTQKQFTENLWTWKHSFMHLPTEICPSISNSLIIIRNLLKHLTLIHIKASFFCSSYSYSWLFQLIYICNNEIKYSKIRYLKHLTYEVLNL